MHGSIALSPPPDSLARAEVAQSWARSRRAGVSERVRLGPPDGAGDPGTSDHEDTTPLIRAARPVLTRLERALGGSGSQLVLADRDCRLAHRWDERRDGMQTMDRLGLVDGATFLEATIGTNALGTALELRRPVAISGGEHYAEVLRRFRCYARPIHHPLTRRIEGILNVSLPWDAPRPLAWQAVVRAVEDIQERLLRGARTSERQLFAAFEVASRRTRRPLVAIAENTVISNRPGWDLLEPADFASLRELAKEAGPVVTPLRLARGTAVRVRAVRVASNADGVICTIEQAGPAGSAKVSPRRKGGSLPTPRPEPILVSGPCGSGRSAEAARLSLPGPVTTLRATAALVDGEESWAGAFVHAWGRTTGSLVVDDVDLLPERLIALVAESVVEGPDIPVVFTSVERERLTGRAATLATMCRHVNLSPLTKRPQDLAGLAEAVLQRLLPGATVRLTPSVVELLRNQPWPGNLHELTAVMAHVAAHRTAGDVIVSDLPAEYRSAPPSKPLTGLERAERDAIRAALADHGGNKSKAASSLGISRTTLYSRMRALRVTAP